MILKDTGIYRSTARETGSSFLWWFEQAFVIFTLIYMSADFAGVFTPIEAAAAGPRPISSVLLEALVYLIAAILVCIHRDVVIPGIRQAKWVTGLVALALSSAVWAPNPSMA